MEIGRIGRYTLAALFSAFVGVSAAQDAKTVLADASKARMILGWEPSIGFRELVSLMIEADIRNLETALNGGRAAIRRASLAATP